MPDQINKTDLLNLIRTERARLERTLAPLTEAQLTEAGLEQGWSIKDTLAHIAFWEQRMLLRIGQARRGERAERLIQEGEDVPAAINRINAQIFAANRDRPLREVQAEFQRSFQQLLDAVESLSEADLSPDSRLSQALGEPTPEQIAGDSYDHYREHNQAIRTWLDKRDDD